MSLSLDDPELPPHPALALILVFPTTDRYEDQWAVKDARRSESGDNGLNEDIIWFMQTINNACGLYGILHALSNGPARDLVGERGFFYFFSIFWRLTKCDHALIYKGHGSFFATLVDECSSLSPQQRTSYLENSVELERVYKEVAVQGISRVAENAEDEVDYHFVCLVKSHKNGHLYELDGDRKGPIDRGLVLASEEDMLASGGLSVIREYIEREKGNCAFGLMALVHTA
jgi:ubiquitin carboxyl-terminal hydrolase L3